MKNQGHSLDAPAYSTITPINIKGVTGKRLMTVYRTVGCEYDKKGGGCTMCDFAYYACPEVKDVNIESQHKQSIESLKNEKLFIHFDLLTLGNFFNENEISVSLRKSMLESLANITNLKRVLTESRRQYVTIEKLIEAKNYLRNDQILEFAFGYETVNSNLRNNVLRKATPENHLDESLEMCKEAGIDFVAYILIKPQTLNESEGINEAVNTALHVFEKAKKYDVFARVAFEPVFVTHNKPIEVLWKNGDYTPPKLWSIVEVLIQTASKLKLNNTKGKLFVGLSDENLSEGRMSSNCGICDDKIKEEIQAFNGHQDVSRLNKLYCTCKDSWNQEISTQENERIY